MPATGIASSPAGLTSRLFEGIPPNDLAIIRAEATERRFLANSMITNQGNPADHLFLLTSGRARYFFITEEGQKTLLLWLTEGEIVGGAAFLTKASKYFLSAETVKDSSVLVWNRASLRSLVSRHPRLLENALLMASDYLAWYLTDHVALTCRTARQRLAQVLIRLAGVIGQKVPGGVEIDATNEELASASNITPFTASRLISEWQTNHAVAKRRGKILLRSPERLFLNVV
ncbi:MAG TPA: Crp/Fnr family transcriptional regulator [Candidatus Binatus sp.]|jgi:CRP-like cAMP-binding protein|nr:Crp/Fnr family transcriptional regulator [Candidatus Binatus sp.]